MSHATRRRFLKATAAAGLGVYSCVSARPVRAANEHVNLGFISCGGRARELMRAFRNASGATVGALCDPDESRLASASQDFPQAAVSTDLRNLIDDDSVDAVVISTCNHWHCLAAIWAMQAGKDVYVEKPLSHSQWEGRQTVAAAEKYRRVCQVGTQQRSDPMQAEIKKFLHQEQALGAIRGVRVNRYGVRPSIGRRDTPLPPPQGIDMNLWLGPAQEQEIFRNQLHYDWHWDWNTGSGEMGNWGVHVLDDVRNNVFLDQVKLPRRILGGGGRILWDDAGQTPNLHFAYFDTENVPVVIGLANIVAGPEQTKSPSHPGPGSGYIVYCEGGRFEGQRGRGVAFDERGTEIRRFSGNAGNGVHQQNFIDAVRAQDASLLNTPVQIGHDSTGWCNLANIAFRAGQRFNWEAASVATTEVVLWNELLDEMRQTVAAHGKQLDDEQIRLCPVLTMDVECERFVEANADRANRFLKREYRSPFVVPELAEA